MDRTLIDNLTYSVLLSLDDGRSSGSGFFFHYNNIDYLVTAYHVLYNAGNLRCKKILASTLNLYSTQEERIMFEIDPLQTVILESQSEDLAIIPMGSFNKFDFYKQVTAVSDEKLKPTSIGIKLTKNYSDLRIANSVFLIGFPTSLFSTTNKNFDPGKPLMRKGIISGFNLEDNTFIIDCFAYYGNSGCPIIEISEDNKINIIGIVSKYIPLVIEWRNNREPSIINNEYQNSGYSVCIPIDSIINLIKSK